MRDSDLFSLMKTLTEVNELSLYDVEITETDSPIIDLRILHIRKIKFHLCNVKLPRAILPNLPKNVIQQLIIETCIVDERTLSTIFENQQNISALEFDPYYVHPSSIESLKLKNLKLMCNRNVKDILHSQQELTFLDLSRAHIGDEEFLRVCELYHLKQLKLWMDRITWEKLENLSRLSQISELSLSYDRLEVEYARILTNIRLPNLRILRLKFPRLKIAGEYLTDMSQNMPNIQHLYLSNQSISLICVVLEKFRNLDTLIVGCDSDSCEVVDFVTEKITHEKLKNLCIFNRFDQKKLKCEKSLLEVIKNIKSLEKLKLDNININISVYFDQVFEFQEKLTHFFYLNNSTSNTSYELKFDKQISELIRVKGQRLDYFHLNGCEISSHKNQLELEFREQFAMISIKPWRRQITMRNCKWEHGDD